MKNPLADLSAYSGIKTRVPPTPSLVSQTLHSPGFPPIAWQVGTSLGCLLTHPREKEICGRHRLGSGSGQAHLKGRPSPAPAAVPGPHHTRPRARIPWQLVTPKEEA